MQRRGIGRAPPPHCSASRSLPSDFPVTLFCWVTWALELIPGAIQRSTQGHAQETPWAASMGHYHFCFALRGGTWGQAWEWEVSWASSPRSS